MQDPEIPRELDHHALDAYLAYGYVPAPMSAFAAVRKLMPASTLVYCDGAALIERYWRLDYSRKRARAAGAGGGGGDSRRDPPGGATPDGRRRADGRVPLGRHRLLGGRRGDGRELLGAGQDVLDRIRGRAFQRAASGAARRPEVRDRPPRADRAPRRGRDAAEGRAPLRRAVRRPLGDARVLPVALRARARDGGAQRRRRRRELRGL